MTPRGSQPEGPGSLQDDIGRLVADAKRAFREQEASHSRLASELEFALTLLGRVNDYEALRDQVGRYLKDVEKWQGVLADLLTRAQVIEASRAKRERFTEPWWSRRRDELVRALEGHPDTGRDIWLQTFAEALTAGRLDACARLMAEPLSLPLAGQRWLALLRRGTSALAGGRYAEATPMVSFLLESVRGGARPASLDRVIVALLFTLRGRLNLREGWDMAQARIDLETATSLAPDLAPPYLGLGELHRRQQGLDEARELFQKAIDVEPAEPDGYIGMGLMAEDQGWWPEAENWYERGLRSHGEGPVPPVAFDRLLTPVTGNFYLKLAQVTKGEHERALGAVNRAIELGVQPSAEYADAVAHRLRGDLLKDLNREEEAGGAYFEAGRRLVWKGDNEQAIDVLRAAKGLDTANAAVSWFLAEALLLMSSSGPPPDYIEKYVDLAVQEWKGRAATELPDAENSWAYLSRAAMNEQLRKVRKGEEWSLSWEAVAYTERSLLLDPKYAWAWAYLGRSYRAEALGNQMTALHATGKALDHDQYNAQILEERAAALANIGDFDAAEETIDRRLQLGPDPWASYIKAYARLGKGDAEAALQLITDVIDETGGEGKTDDSYLEFRAMCYMRLGDVGAVARDYGTIWGRRDQPEAGGTGAETLAWAAFASGDVPSAIAMTRKTLEERAEETSRTQRRLGLFLLGNGDIGEGEGVLKEGISEAPLPTDLEELLRMHFPYLTEVAAERGHPEAGRALEELRAEVVQRIGELHVPTPVEELQDDLADLEKSGQTDGWDWIAATAGLARLHTEAKLWKEATDAYRLLVSRSDQFPEAARGLAQVALGMQNDGDEVARAGDSSGARDTFREALSLAAESKLDDPATVAGLKARLAFMAFDLGDPSGGSQQLEEALKDPGAGTGIGSRIGDIGASLVMDVAQYWALDDQIRALEDRAESPDVVYELASLRASLAKVLATLFRLSPPEGDANLQPSDFREMAVDIGKGLEGEGEDWSRWPMFVTYIPEMRDRLHWQTGVSPPGIHVRGSNDLARDQYVIKLHETPVARGSTQLGMIYSPTSLDALERAGLAAQARVEMPEPGSGRNGWWMDADVGDAAARMGLEVWPDPASFVIRHVEAVLRTHVGHYVGPDGVQNWADDWGVVPGSEGDAQAQASQLVRALLVDGASAVRLSRVLRALVDEMVPVADRGRIAESLSGIGLSDEVQELVRLVRRALREQLPSNVPRAHRVWLPAEMEAEMKTWLTKDGPGMALAVPTDRLLTVINAIRDLIPEGAAGPIIVTRDIELRPYVRSLLAPVLPTVPVLLEDELVQETATVSEAVAVSQPVPPEVPTKAGPVLEQEMADGHDT